jgi:ubiquinone/menaquinone biosynthesis C-methylase UbiE
MNIQQAYNAWSETYDIVQNKTRDLEARALRESVQPAEKLDILEIGCGTGKNTQYLLTVANNLIAADFSAEMLERAKAKICAPNVKFRRMDLGKDWPFDDESFDLVSSSLVLEHLENIDFVFRQAERVLRSDGRFYLGELHPFRQYQGGKARFETGQGLFELECFTHHISDFSAAGLKNGLRLVELREWFDDDEPGRIPRVLSMIFSK